MAKFFEELTDKHRRFILSQPMFFVATAAAEGRINLSPKGMDTFRVLGPNLVAYMDFIGSGNETAAHVLASGRITFMFCSFGKNPLILRVYGQGRSVKPGSMEFEELCAFFPQMEGVRQIFLVEVESAQTSCGKAVPRIDNLAERTQLVDELARLSPEDAADYKARKNAVSIDGLPTGLEAKQA